MRKLLVAITVLVALAVIPTAAIAKKSPPQNQLVVRVKIDDYVTDGGVAKIRGTLNNRGKGTLRYVVMYLKQTMDDSSFNGADFATATKADGLRLGDRDGLTLAIGPLKPGIRRFTVWVKVINRSSKAEYIATNFYCVRVELGQLDPGKGGWMFKNSRPTCGQYVVKEK